MRRTVITPCTSPAAGAGAICGAAWCASSACRSCAGSIGASRIGVATLTVFMLALWWRLSSGPIELDIATPWLKAAIEENFGGAHSVVVGGTQIERDENGRTSLRLRDIVVRDADGTVVASAPKAEVGISGMSLLSGHMRAREPQSGRRRNGGADRDRRSRHRVRRRRQAADRHRHADRAIAAYRLPPGASPPDALKTDFQNLAGVLAWLDGVGRPAVSMATICASSASRAAI